MIIRKVFQDCTLQSYANSFTKHAPRLITKRPRFITWCEKYGILLINFPGVKI